MQKVRCAVAFLSTLPKHSAKKLMKNETKNFVWLLVAWRFTVYDSYIGYVLRFLPKFDCGLDSKRRLKILFMLNLQIYLFLLSLRVQACKQPASPSNNHRFLRNFRDVIWRNFFQFSLDLGAIPERDKKLTECNVKCLFDQKNYENLGYW